MKDDLISIVVPIYNVEKYIKKCVDSIINQTYRNLEIILVDDGSPDNCGQICDEYANKDKRIKVIHKENGGLSDARNAGIDIATGEYIAFLDSDDWIEEDYISIMYEELKKNNVKLVQCSINKVSDAGDIINTYDYSKSQLLDAKNVLADVYRGHAIENVVAWNKLYDIKLFKNIRYPIGKIHEDEFTTYKILYSIDKIYIINKKLYNYREAENSIMKEKFSIKRLNRIEAIKERVDFFEENKEEDLYQITVIYFLDSLIHYYALVKIVIKDKEECEKLYQSFKLRYKKLNIKVNLKKRLKYFLFYHFHRLYSFLWILLKKDKILGDKNV